MKDTVDIVFNLETELPGLCHAGSEITIKVMDSALNAGHFHEVASITRVLNDVKKKLIEEKDHMEDDPNADINDLELGEKVGSGGFGEVFRGRYQGVRSSVNNT